MQSLRAQALSIFRAALEAAAPDKAVLNHVKVRNGVLIAGRERYRLSSFRNIYVIGAGKAGARMSQAVERLLGKRITSGLINVKYGEKAILRRIELNEADHPAPDRSGEEGARRIAKMAEGAGADDLIVCLISGGASSLLPLPSPPVTLEEKRKTTRLLLACGATIHEMNCVRKHISAVKGGQLARLAYPATVLTLLLSDVIGDDLDVIGSGPTVADPSTRQDAKVLLEKYRIWNKVPAAVRDKLTGAGPETPKPGDAIFAKVQNLIVGSNRLAVTAAVHKAKALGFRTLALTTSLAGEAREAAHVYAAIARELATSGNPVKRPACVISGGETTVTIRGKGLGGRNQEFAMAAAQDIAGLKDVLLFSAGTDGIDGPTDAAGALVDGETLTRAERLGLNVTELLENNDSYYFFERLGDLIHTGPTGTNVADIQIILAR